MADSLSSLYRPTPSAPAPTVAIDPQLGASVYAAGHLDHAVAALGHAVQRAHPHVRLWMRRHQRRGPHVKLRLHLPAATHADAPDPAEAVRATVDAAAATLFAALDARDPRDPDASRARDPATYDLVLDDHDEVEGLAPDRSIAWTQPRLHAVSYDAPALRGEAALRDALTQTHAAATDLVLDAYGPDGTGLPLAQRTGWLTRALASGLGALIPALDDTRSAAELRRIYLNYHSTWLLHSVRGNAAGAQEAIAVLDQRIARMDAAVTRLSTHAQQRYQRAGVHDDDPATWSAWRTAINKATTVARDACARHLAAIDPKALEAGVPAFAPLFRMFHGLSNLLDFRLVDEAFAHRLLLRAEEIEA